MRLVLLAHGSRDPRWRAPFVSLRDRLVAALDGAPVALAYLDFAPPSLAEAVAEAVREGERAFRIVPLFMAGGGHVEHDVPVQVRALEATHPGIAIEVLPAIGEHPGVVAAMIGALAAAAQAR